MNEEHIAAALIGDEADKFFKSDLGRTIVGMAQQELLEAQIALETVNSTDVLAIEKLQNKAWRARQIQSWLQELITEGEHALEVLKHESQER